MNTPEHGRDPCPYRIMTDVGGAFGMGALGGSAWHFIRGIKNSPRGERILGGTQAVRINAPRIGGSFAVWGGLFSSFDCGMVYLRQKEDPWNPILAGAATGGFLQLRAGAKFATRAAIFGGVFLALIEGAGIMMNRAAVNMGPPRPLEEQMPQMGMPGASYPKSSPPSGLPTTFNVPDSPPMPVNLAGTASGDRKLDTESGIPRSPADPSSSNRGNSSWWGGLFSGHKGVRP